jgi:L-ascorbate metabolism protein UlaG (beta-lactamase superfamily)
MAEIDINEVVKALDNIEVNSQSSIRIKSDVTVYFDPFQIKEERHDADYILITHNHYDHLDLESIKKLQASE